jgi:hypothetical protein
MVIGRIKLIRKQANNAKRGIADSSFNLRDEGPVYASLQRQGLLGQSARIPPSLDAGSQALSGLLESVFLHPLKLGFSRPSVHGI